MIHKQEPLVSVLRLLILFSVTNAGLPKKNFDYLRQVSLRFISIPELLLTSISVVNAPCVAFIICLLFYRRELLHSYGFEHMATLNSLEKAGLLKKQVSELLDSVI